jgi:methionyl-tRNA formyltransferase
MINNFKIDNIKNVCIIGGYANYFEDLKKINYEYNINTLIISSPSFKKFFRKDEDILYTKNIDSKFNLILKKKIKKENTIFMSFGARWIFKENQISRYFNNQLVNFHGTRLPLDAGGGGFSWRIMRGDRLGANLVHLVNERIDTGPILLFEEYIFPSFCKKTIDFENFYKINFLKFYNKFLKKLINKDKIKILNQNPSLGVYNPRLNTKINGWINWNWDAHSVYNFINAFDDPYLGASTTVNNKFTVRLKDVHLHGGEIKFHPYSSGLVIRKNKDWLIVSLGSGWSLIVEKVLDKKNSNILNKIKVGDRFCTNINYLNKSFSFREFYKP